MAQYKLLYFNLRGRGEPIRYILLQAGVPFEDHRVTKEEWIKLKPITLFLCPTPMGQLPVLVANGKQLSQHTAIANYLGREHGLGFSSSWETAVADMLLNGILDNLECLRPIFNAVWVGDTNKEKEAWISYKSQHMTPFLDLYEKFLIDNGGKFFVGDHLTVVDLIMAELLDRFMVVFDNESVLANHKHLLALVKYVHELPNIKKYVASRPKVHF